MIRRLNEIMLALLSHASLPSNLWVEALHTAVYLHNILPSKLLQYHSPMVALYQRHPSYDHLRIFGCACFPNANATHPHKLAPRSSLCVFLGYPANYQGYRCLDLSTGKTILLRHVTFDESHFPYPAHSLTPQDYSFLDPSPVIFHPPTFSLSPPPSSHPSAPPPSPTAPYLPHTLRPHHHHPPQSNPNPTTQPPPLTSNTLPIPRSHLHLTL